MIGGVNVGKVRMEWTRTGKKIPVDADIVVQCPTREIMPLGFAQELKIPYAHALSASLHWPNVFAAEPAIRDSMCGLS